MTQEEFEALLYSFASPGRVVARSEDVQIKAMASALREVNDGQVQKVVDAAVQNSDPLMRVYQSDGWGVTLPTVSSFQYCGARRTANGFLRAEHLLELSVIKRMGASSVVDMAITLPRAMQLASKSGWHIFQASCDAVAVDQEGHNGVLISVYLQDGLHANGFVRRHRGRHDLNARVAHVPLAEHTVQKRRDHDWVFGFRCVLHSGSSPQDPNKDPPP